MNVPCTHCLQNEEFRMEPTHFNVTHIIGAITEKQRVVYCKGMSSRPVAIASLAPDLALADSAANVIDFSELEMGELLGEGGFAKVYKANYNGQPVAVKALNAFASTVSSPTDSSSNSSNSSSSLVSNLTSSSLLSSSSSSSSLDQDAINSFSEFQREAWLMSGIRSPFLVELKGLVLDPLCLVMEFLPQGSLYELIHDTEKLPNLSFNMINKIALNIAQGMKILHNSVPQIIREKKLIL